MDGLEIQKNLYTIKYINKTYTPIQSRLCKGLKIVKNEIISKSSRTILNEIDNISLSFDNSKRYVELDLPQSIF